MTDVKTILGVPVAQVKSVSNIPITDVKTILESNVSLIATLDPTGDGTGVATLRLQVSDEQTVKLVGDAKFYTDAGGTLNESSEWVVTPGALRTIYLKCPAQSRLIIPTPSGVIGWGDASTDGWVSSTNAPQITIEVGKLSLLNLRITGNSILIGKLPSGITYLHLNGNNINWTYTGALPSGITYLHLNGNNINWTYTGALPSGITGALYLSGNNINWTYTGALPSGITGILYLIGPNINWTYTGALPSGITGTIALSGNNINWTYTGALPSGITGTIILSGNNINWTYTGALPSGITYLHLNGNNINWTYTGALPSGITYLSLFGDNINWTYNKIEGTTNFTTFNLANYRTNKMSSADMVVLLDSMRTKTGTFPATVTINDYADYASPPSEVVNAVNALKAAKSITTVNLGA